MSQSNLYEISNVTLNSHKNCTSTIFALAKKTSSFFVHCRDKEGCLFFFSSLLSVSPLRSRLLLLTVPWFCVGMTAYGVHFTVKFLNFDIFVISVIKEAAIVVIILAYMSIYSKASNN